MNQENSCTFEILSINISKTKGIQKTPIDAATLKENHGIIGDAHAGDWHRQVSLLADEDIDTMRGRGADITFGTFAENITTRGLPLSDLPLGARIQLGEVMLEITQKGKECHHGCAIFEIVGDCVMPRRGVFARVTKGGTIRRESKCRYYIR